MFLNIVLSSQSSDMLKNFPSNAYPTPPAQGVSQDVLIEHCRSVWHFQVPIKVTTLPS